MLDKIIHWSLNHRLAVLLLAALLLIFGGAAITGIPVDVFPDFTAPTVTVITEAKGMAPEEIELLVTFPLESALNGAPDIRRVRSVSAAGLSVVWVEFNWGKDIYQARQIVNERLQSVSLPKGADAPQLGPISSIMGEITFLAITSESHSPMDLRILAETLIRRKLLAIQGISKVVPMGGDIRQFSVELDPLALDRHRVPLNTVWEVLQQAGDSPAAGFHLSNGQEYLVRGLGRIRKLEDLSETVVASSDGVPVLLRDIARVTVDAEPKRGIASYCTKPAVILSVQKQPGANTLELTERIDRMLEQLQNQLPAGVVLEKENFRQADFIEIAIANVTAALRDGAILVVIVLFFFLGNFRTTLISALAIPLSLISSILVISVFGQTINTMTLGGLTIAIGALVDDAIIDVENVFRRLKQERLKPEQLQRPSLMVVFHASSEIRSAVLFATLIIILVFAPLFMLSGMEGRLLFPLGFSYVSALAISLLVALTVTPVLCSLLIPSSRILERKETRLLRVIKWLYRPSLKWALKHRLVVLSVTLVMTIASLALVPLLGSRFLPSFNEGAFTVDIVSPPGITLEDSDRLGRRVEEVLLTFPEVVSTSRRTGRAEKDEHVQGVNASEMEVVLRPGRPKEELLPALRAAVAPIPGISVNFGQPISHRIDHMLSGVKTNLAVKIFGPDLSVLRQLAARVTEIIQTIPGIVDVSNQEQAVIPQLIIDFDRRTMSRHGMTASYMARTVEAIFQGTMVGEIVEDGFVSRIVVRLPENLRENRDQLDLIPMTTPDGTMIRLGQVARLRFDIGPSLIRRENVQRVVVLSANVEGRDLTGIVDQARAKVSSEISLPAGYQLEFGGQFAETVKSFQNIMLYSGLAIIGMYGLLYFAFRNHRHTLIVLVNLPLALIGGIVAVFSGDQVISVASLVGFITLFGIATRNGVLLVSEYQHLAASSDLTLMERVYQGSCERLAPILMTALTAGLALTPLLMAAGKAGNEIQSPMAQVIAGGLLTSTFLNLILVPVLFSLWGERRGVRPQAPGSGKPRYSSSLLETGERDDSVEK